MIQHVFVIFCHNVHLFAREINGSEVQTNFPVVPAPRKVMQAIFEAMLEGDLPIDEAFREGVMSVVGVEVTYGLLRRYNRIK